MRKLLLTSAAAVALFTSPLQLKASNSNQKVDPKAVVAKIDGKKITMLDLAQLFQSLPPQLQKMPIERAYPTLVNELINRHLIVLEAKKAGLDKDKDVKKAIDETLKKIKEQIFYQAYIEKKIKIADKEIRAKYEELKKSMKNEQEVKASHILVKTEKEAKNIIKSLNDGAKFEKLAREKSIDKGSAQNGGDLGYFGRGDMLPEFTEAAFKLKNGKYTKDPIETKFGYHVIWKKDQRKRKPPTFEQARNILRAQVMQKKIGGIIEKVSKKHKIERFSMDGKKITDAEKSSS